MFFMSLCLKIYRFVSLKTCHSVPPLYVFPSQPPLPNNCLNSLTPLTPEDNSFNSYKYLLKILEY